VWISFSSFSNNLVQEIKPFFVFYSDFPRVTVGPENPLRIEKDATATLTCSVDAKPAVSNVRWTRGGRFIATSFSHSLPRVALQDAGSYVCTADNGLGRPGEAELNLDVLYPPLVAVEPRREAEEGESIRVHCNVSANPAPISVEWVRPDRPDFRQSGSILSLHRITSDSAGTYMCRAINLVNSNGQEYERVGNASLSLRVRHKPGAAKISPEKPVATEGSSIILTCEANPSGWPAPQYRWWKDSSEAAIATGARFAINSAHLNTEGTYHCQATNEMGHGTSAAVQLQVHQAPRFIAKIPTQKTKK
jgi:echinoid